MSYNPSIKKKNHAIYFTELRLRGVENDIRGANLEERILKLRDTNNAQNKLINEFENDLKYYETEVNNLKAIADSLPSGCFKRPRLEP